ncbi:MAG: hypothetical protein ING32_01500 [Curvibacter sp.]|nr:hypothetical protein [Curvibacter sp.]
MDVRPGGPGAARTAAHPHRAHCPGGPAPGEVALERQQYIVAQAAQVPEIRRPTKPTYGSRQRRLEGKALRSQVKATRRRVDDQAGNDRERKRSPLSPIGAARRRWQ